MDPIIFAQLNEAYHNGVYEKKELEPDPFGRPGGKHGGVPAPGSGYDRAWKAIQKKNKENKKNTNEELDIQEWVDCLVDQGYDLDEYTDDELYVAYLDEVKGGGFIPQSGTTYNTDYQSPSAQRRQAHRTSGWSGRGEQEKSMQKAGIRSRTAVGSREEIPSRNNMGTGTSPSGSDSGLSMSPAKRAELAAKRAERGGDSKRANKIRSTMSRPPVSEDIYDLVSEYLVSEGFCDSYEDADVIMVNMSEEWRDGILDEVTGGGKIKFRKGLPGRSPKKAGMEMTPQQKAALKLGKMDVDPSTDPKRRERQARVALR
jgi:hypothetical protein